METVTRQDIQQPAIRVEDVKNMLRELAADKLPGHLSREELAVLVVYFDKLDVLAQRAVRVAAAPVPTPTLREIVLVKETASEPEPVESKKHFWQR